MISSFGIVLSYQNFGEADRYIQFLTKDWGVITTLAKAARKSQRRYMGGLDLFCHNQIWIRNAKKERAYLTELVVRNSFLGLREDLAKLTLAGKLVQWMQKLLPPATPVPSAYQLLGQSLALLEMHSRERQEKDASFLDALFLTYKLKLLSLVGIQPRFNSCVRCNQKGEEALFLEKKDFSFFDFKWGGVLCATCLAKIPTEKDRVYLSKREFFFLEELNRFSLARWQEKRLAEWEEKEREEEKKEMERATILKKWNSILSQFTRFHTHLYLPE